MFVDDQADLVDREVYVDDHIDLIDKQKNWK